MATILPAAAVAQRRTFALGATSLWARHCAAALKVPGRVQAGGDRGLVDVAGVDLVAGRLGREQHDEAAVLEDPHHVDEGVAEVAVALAPPQQRRRRRRRCSRRPRSRHRRRPRRRSGTRRRRRSRSRTPGPPGRGRTRAARRLRSRSTRGRPGVARGCSRRHASRRRGFPAGAGSSPPTPEGRVQEKGAPSAPTRRAVAGPRGDLGEERLGVLDARGGRAPGRPGPGAGTTWTDGRPAGGARASPGAGSSDWTRACGTATARRVSRPERRSTADGSTVQALRRHDSGSRRRVRVDTGRQPGSGPSPRAAASQPRASDRGATTASTASGRPRACRRAAGSVSAALVAVAAGAGAGDVDADAPPAEAAATTAAARARRPGCGAAGSSWCAGR